MNALTMASEHYMSVFGNYISLFTHWGQWLFYSLLTIHIVWLSMWYAFDSGSLSESMPRFLKQFAIIAVFYTILMHPEWLNEILISTKVMGHRLTGLPVDPSSLIEQGIMLGNKIVTPVSNAGFFNMGFGLLTVWIVYVIILFVFISIALDLAVTMIMTTAMIALSPFLLGFAALQATQSIARQNLDIILGNCVKLLGIYLVVGAGSQTLTDIAANIPTNADSLYQVGFDPYAWTVSAALLFWLLAKNLPNQLAKMVSIAVQDLQGTSSAAIAMTALQTAKMATSAIAKIGELAHKPMQAAKSFGTEMGGKAYDRLFNKGSGEGADASSSKAPSHSNGSLSAQLKSISDIKAGSSQTSTQGKNK